MGRGGRDEWVMFRGHYRSVHNQVGGGEGVQKNKVSA